MPRTSWRGVDIVFIVVILAFACVAAYFTIKLTWPKSFASAGFGVEWQCSTSLGILTVCTRNALFEQRLRSAAKGELAV